MYNDSSPNKTGNKYLTFKTAFPYTIPFFLGFWFIDFSYGIYMHLSGFSFLYPFFMSLLIYGGSLEFVTVTMLTRFLPFFIFSESKPTPIYIQYLGQALPPAIFAMLVVYCLKNVSWVSGTHGLPELIGIGITALLHLWKRQMLLSIAGGTIAYMFFYSICLYIKKPTVKQSAFFVDVLPIQGVFENN